MAKSTSVDCPIVGHKIKVYETEKDALTYIKFNAEGDTPLHAFCCTMCGGWHVSHNVPSAEQMQQVYDMIDKKRELDEASRKEKREMRKLKEKRVQDLIDLYNEINDSPSEDRCEHYVMTMFDCFQVLTRRNATKKALRLTFSNRYGIDIDKEFLNLGKEDVDFKERIMNLAEKMKKVMQGVKVVDKIDLDSIPDKKTKEEKKENRKFMRKMHELRDKAHNLELVIADLEKEYASHEEEICQKAAERKQKELRKEYVICRMNLRAKYTKLDMSTGDRQKDLCFQGIRPEPMEVVHFHIPKIGGAGKEADGVALVRDENHYYIAIDLYDQPEQEDNITTCMDENPDGTFEGIWPKYVILKNASKYEERFVRSLVDKYADDIEKAKAYVENVVSRDIEECKVLNAEINALTAEINKYGKIDVELQKKRKDLAKIEEEMNALTLEQKKEKPAPEPMNDPLAILQRNVAESQSKAKEEPVAKAEVSEPVQTEEVKPKNQACPPDLLDFSCDEDEDTGNYSEYKPKMRNHLIRRLTPPDLTETEQKYPHLAYIRMKRELQDMEYPYIDLEMKAWLRFRLMANIARLFDRVGRIKPLTYVLSQEYFDELCHRGKTAYRGMSPDSVVTRGEIARGVIVFPNQGYEDTIVYDFNNCGNLTILLAYIREGQLMFYESYTTQQLIGEPRIDNFMCKSMREAGTDIGQIYNFVKNLVVSFLAMECDMQRTMKHFVDDGQAEEVVRDIPEGEFLNHDLDEDVVIRDANWYSSISIDHLIPVQGYVSHRWVGTGKQKTLQEVWVRPHSRNGYHREAGAAK